MKKTREIVQHEALEIIHKELVSKGKVGVSICMGVGKTLICLKNLNSNYQLYGKVSALVVAPKKSVFDSWRNEARLHGLEYLLPSIHFSTYLSLSKQDLLKYDVVYLDECHNLLPSHEEWLSKFSGKIVGVTGTPPRFVTSEKGKLVNTFCPISYEYSVENAIADGVLNDYEIFIHYIPLSDYKNVKVGKRNWYVSEKESYAYWNKRIDESANYREEEMARIQRMKAMMGFSSKVRYSQKLLQYAKTNNLKCIVFTNTQEQADLLCAHSYHSKNVNSKEYLEKFKSGEITTLSTVLQLVEGVNIPNLKRCLILHAYANERKTSQRIGRMLRLNPDEKASIHILCYKDTIDEKWVMQALADFDQSKITHRIIDGI